VSGTLGLTQLRLRKGESLPRSKRIFHISSSERRHLDDVLELLIKFKYIMRSPLSPTGHHLFGLSSYLVPRAKPDSMGRLIVDFSTINSLLESYGPGSRAERPIPSSAPRGGGMGTPPCVLASGRWGPIYTAVHTQRMELWATSLKSYGC
jgi:hypothetical protein